MNTKPERHRNKADTPPLKVLRDRVLCVSGFLNILLKAVGITLLAFVLSSFLVAPFSASTSAIFSSPEKSDFVLTDLFAQVADGRPVRSFEDRLVIVDVGHSDRYDIAEALSIISLCGPKAVGVDINFELPMENDSVLLAALSSLPGAVVPLGVSPVGKNSFEIKEKPFYYGADLPVGYGVVNLPTKVENGTVREFAVDYDVDGRKVPSFVTAVAELADPDAAKRLRAHGSDHGIISYHSRQLNIIPLHDLVNRADELAGRITLVGSLQDAYDMHPTPVRSNMSGLEIHAYALATVLDGTWMRKAPDWLDGVVAAVICFLIVLATIGIKGGARGLLIRIVQVVTAYLAVRIGYTLFVDRDIVCNFSQTLLMIAFGLFAIDIWNGGVAIIGAIRKKITAIHKKDKLTCEESY